MLNVRVSPGTLHELKEYAREQLVVTNQHRAKEGLKPLTRLDLGPVIDGLIKVHWASRLNIPYRKSYACPLCHRHWPKDER